MMGAKALKRGAKPQVYSDFRRLGLGGNRKKSGAEMPAYWARGLTGRAMGLLSHRRER
jgi:hypothetical protein